MYICMFLPGQGRVLEFRAEQEALKIKSEAKKKAVQVERVWADTVKDMVDVPARIDLLTKQAHVKSDRLRSQVFVFLHVCLYIYKHAGVYM